MLITITSLQCLMKNLTAQHREPLVVTSYIVHTQYSSAAKSSTSDWSLVTIANNEQTSPMKSFQVVHKSYLTTILYNVKANISQTYRPNNRHLQQWSTRRRSVAMPLATCTPTWIRRETGCPFSPVPDINADTGSAAWLAVSLGV